MNSRATERRKIASFCNVRTEAVIPALDVDTIYAVPIRYHEEGMDREVLRHFGLNFDAEPDLSRWLHIVDAVRAPEGDVRIAWRNGGAVRDTAALWSEIASILGANGLLPVSAAKELAHVE